MAFDGSGIFMRLRNWVADATAGVKIRADFHDIEDDNFAAGLTNCITKDGQTTITQNIKWNSKRLTALADPIDPQDASTKAYADTKASLAGGSTFTSDVVFKEATPSLTLDATSSGKNSIFGQKSDKNRWEIVLGNATAESGSNAGSDFELVNYADDGTLIGDVLVGTRATGLLTVKADPTATLGIATKQYTDAAAVTKLPIAGGTITGNLGVSGQTYCGGELIAAQNYIRFGYSGSPGFLQWLGGGSYVLSGGGTIWHSGNFNPNAASANVTNMRLIYAGDVQHSSQTASEPIVNAIVTGGSGVVGPYIILKYRYIQLYTTGWFTVGYA